MSSKRELYKAKPKARNGLGSRDVRIRLKAQESKSGRDALLSSRRGIPLSAVQEKSTPKKKVTDQQTQSELRLQKLKEWQAKRDKAREKDKSTKKKPFNCGGSRPDTNTARKTGPSHGTVSEKSTTARFQATGGNIQKSTSARSVGSKVNIRAAHNVSCDLPPKSTAMTDVKSKQRKKVATNNPPPPIRASRRIAERVHEKNVNPSTTRSRQARVTGETAAIKSENAPRVTRSGGKMKSKDDVHVRGGSTRSGKKRVKVVDRSESTDTASSPSPPHTFTQHTPSPEHDLATIPACAWLPMKHVATRIKTAPSFDDILGPCTFSPFKFTAGSNVGGGAVAMATPGDDKRSKFKTTPGKGCMFSFRKVVDDCPLPMPTGDAVMQNDVMTDTTMSSDSLECEQPVSMETQQSTHDPKVDSEGGIDFPYFRKLHDDVADELTAKCSQWRAKNEELERKMEEESDDHTHLEEAIDQIRTTIGQAELLKTKKMKQYYKLVADAVDDGGKTSAEDLQGFWDLVSIQVDDVRCKFESMEELERNSWKPPQLEQNGAKKRGMKRVTASSSAAKKPVSKKQAAARERREAMRSRLREMKKEASRRAQEEEGMEENQEMEKIEDTSNERPSTPCHGNSLPDNHSSSKRKSTGKGRRRSRRLGRRSSVALIDFSEVSTTTGVEPSSSSTTPHMSPPSTHNPSCFSPPQDTSSSTVAGPHSEVSIAELLNFNNQSPHRPPFKSPLKWISKGVTPVKMPPPGGASVHRFVSVTPSKRLREMMAVDVVMSPARRSLRIAEKFGTSADGSHGNYQVASLNDLPQELDVGYLPNKALL